MTQAEQSTPPHELLAGNLYWAYGDTIEAPETTRLQELRYSAAAFWANAHPIREAFRDLRYDESQLHVRSIPAGEPLPDLDSHHFGLLQLLVDHRTQFLDTRAGRSARDEAREFSMRACDFDQRFREMAADPLYTGPDASMFVDEVGLAVSRTVLYARGTSNRSWRYLALNGAALRSEVDYALPPPLISPILLGGEAVRRVVVVSEPRKGTISQNQIGAARLLTTSVVPKGRHRRLLQEAAGLLWEPLPGGAAA